MGLRNFEENSQEEKQKVTSMERTLIDGLSKSRTFGIEEISRKTENKTMSNNIRDLITSGGNAYSISGIGRAAYDASRGSAQKKKMGHYMLAQQVSAESIRMDLSDAKTDRFDSDELQWIQERDRSGSSSSDGSGSGNSSNGYMINKIAVEAENGLDSPDNQVVASWNGITESENSPIALGSHHHHRQQQLQSSSLHPYIAAALSSYSKYGGTMDHEESRVLPSSPELDECPNDIVPPRLQHETDSSLFPDSSANKTMLGNVLGAFNARILGLSPRQRLLYRYQLELEMMKSNDNRQQQQQQQHQKQELQGNAPNSCLPIVTPTDACLDDAFSTFLSMHDHVHPADSPNSWLMTNSSSDKSIENNHLQLQQMMTSSHAHVCHICNYAAGSKADYDGHMEGSHFTYKCLICPYSSRSPGRLNRHMIDFHSSSDSNDAPANKKSKRLRKYNCKQCAFATIIQEEMWEHTRVHVPASKLLSCPRCPFVCAFKHHMQYHMNNHFGFKPFKCEKCNYQCNNKSMLNSHQKSHSNDYPFRCGSCYYAAKYRHALNLHLQKKNHVPVGDIASGGDLLTTAQEEKHQRTPRVRSRGRSSSAGMSISSASLSRNRAFLQELINSRPPFEEEAEEEEGEEEEELIAMPPWLEAQPMEIDNSVNENIGEESNGKKISSSFTSYANLLQPPLLPISEMHYRFFDNRHSPAAPAPALIQIPSPPMPILVRNMIQCPPIGRERTLLSSQHVKSIPINQTFASDIVRELSSEKPGGYITYLQPGMTTCTPPPAITSNNNCRDFTIVSGTNYNLNDVDGGTRRPSRKHSLSDEAFSHDDSVNDVDTWPLDLTAKVVDGNGSKTGGNTTGAIDGSGESAELDWYECQHCGIIFPDRVLYSMHMGYHNKSDPFQCNLCGQKTRDRRDFFSHISMVAHE